MSTAISTNGEQLAQLAEQVNAADLDAEASARRAIDAAMRAGELLTDAKTLCRHGEFIEWVAEHTHVTPRRVQQYMKLWRRRAELPNANSSSHLSVAGALRLLDDGATRETINSSESVEWYTPEAVIDRVVEVLETIDLDPCSNRGDPNIPAAKHYTIDDDGLIRPWLGKVYMNPPFGKPIAEWVDRLIAEHEAGNVTEAIAMLPDSTSAAWFQPLWRFLICFASPRITFVDGSGQRDNPSNTHGSAIVYLGDRPERFCRAFEDIGVVTSMYSKSKSDRNSRHTPTTSSEKR